MNKSFRGALITAMLGTVACAPAAEVDPPKSTPEARLAAFFADKEAVNNFIQAAQGVDFQPDPLRRCLTFPDFPVQDWPEGSAAAFCEYVFGPYVGAKQFEDAAASGDFTGIEAALSGDLRKHFSKSEYSEAIHADFDAFDGSALSDRLSQAWLSKSPGSAFALAARGTHFLALMDEARRGRTYHDMDEESRRSQAENAGAAIDFFRKALAIEPRLMPVYIGMASAATADSRDDVKADAIRRGSAVDPLCVPFATEVMSGLQPKWGGSKDEMDAYAATLTPHLHERPTLLLPLALIAVQASDAAWQNNDYKGMQAAVAPTLMRNPTGWLMDQMTIGSMYDITAPQEAPVVYSLAASRFQIESARGLRRRGTVLFHNHGDASWAMIILRRAVEMDPENGDGHFALGEVYTALRKVDDARQQFALAQRDENSREQATEALRRLSEPPTFVPGQELGPDEALRRAAAAGPEGAPGVYGFDIAAVYPANGHIYVNSSPDPRDPANVTVDLTPGITRIVEERLNGSSIPEAFQNRRILVKGNARRVADESNPHAGTTLIEVSEKENLRVLDKR